jgi:hypothetical protein
MIQELINDYLNNELYFKDCVLSNGGSNDMYFFYILNGTELYKLGEVASMTSDVEYVNLYETLVEHYGGPMPTHTEIAEGHVQWIQLAQHGSEGNITCYNIPFIPLFSGTNKKPIWLTIYINVKTSVGTLYNVDYWHYMRQEMAGPGYPYMYYNGLHLDDFLTPTPNYDEIIRLLNNGLGNYFVSLRSDSYSSNKQRLWINSAAPNGEYRIIEASALRDNIDFTIYDETAKRNLTPEDLETEFAGVILELKF